MKIVIGCDHVAVELKNEIIRHLTGKGYTVEDVGAYTDERTDYTIYGEKVARLVASGEYDRGIAICGTGVGIGMTCNKITGIRCVTCSEPYSAKLSRQHNDTNCLAFGARVVGVELAKMIVDNWIETEYEGGRHQRRVDRLLELDQLRCP